MAWLVRDGEVLASVEVAARRRDRWRGLLGRSEVTGGIVLPSTRWVHSLGMHFSIDVGFVDSDGVVVDVVTMAPWRIARPRLGCAWVLEAERGAFARWHLEPGDRVEIANG